MIRQAYYPPKTGSSIKLDEYISDLNLEIAAEGYSCQPMCKDGFAYMWAGAKANYGVRRGKVCYEVRISENLEVSTADFTDINVVRVGWSTDAATLQLGEDKNSFGYGGTARKSEARKFVEYGRRFGKGDVIGCYLAIENGWADISYCVNGRFCGSAYKVRWNAEEALYPHILTKNCKLEINFGQAPNPYFSLQPGFKLVDHIPVELKIPAVQPPVSKKQCEVIMMVGLPGVGKSTWAMNYTKIHPSKKYNILGTDAIIDKMRVQGLPRKNNFGGRWDVLIKQASECFSALLKKASNCNRNMILDQTNVYVSARKRKVRQYKDAGYTVNAMVLVPTDEEMMRRSHQRTIEEGKEVPEAAVLDMKANYSLPHEDENLFANITFLELQREDAENLVIQYNADANMKGYKSNKQSGVGANQNQQEKNESNRSSSQQRGSKISPRESSSRDRSEDSRRSDSRQRDRDSSRHDRERDRSHDRRDRPERKSRWDRDQDRSTNIRGETKKRPESDRRAEPPEKYRRDNPAYDYDQSAGLDNKRALSAGRSNIPSRRIESNPPIMQNRPLNVPSQPPQGRFQGGKGGAHDANPPPVNRGPKPTPGFVKQEPQYPNNQYDTQQDMDWQEPQDQRYYQEENFGKEQNFYEQNTTRQMPVQNRPPLNPNRPPVKREPVNTVGGQQWPNEAPMPSQDWGQNLQAPANQRLPGGPMSKYGTTAQARGPRDNVQNPNNNFNRFNQEQQNVYNENNLGTDQYDESSNYPRKLTGNNPKSFSQQGDDYQQYDAGYGNEEEYHGGEDNWNKQEAYEQDMSGSNDWDNQQASDQQSEWQTEEDYGQNYEEEEPDHTWNTQDPMSGDSNWNSDRYYQEEQMHNEPTSVQNSGNYPQPPNRNYRPTGGPRNAGRINEERGPNLNRGRQMAGQNMGPGRDVPQDLNSPGDSVSKFNQGNNQRFGLPGQDENISTWDLPENRQDVTEYEPNRNLRPGQVPPQRGGGNFGNACGIRPPPRGTEKMKMEPADRRYPQTGAQRRPDVGGMGRNVNFDREGPPNDNQSQGGNGRGARPTVPGNGRGAQQSFVRQPSPRTDQSTFRPRFNQPRLPPPPSQGNIRPQSRGRGPDQFTESKPNLSQNKQFHQVEEIKDSTLSQLTSVDFDNLKASLANIRHAQQINKALLAKHPYDQFTDQQILDMQFPPENQLPKESDAEQGFDNRDSTFDEFETQLPRESARNRNMRGDSLGRREPGNLHRPVQSNIDTRRPNERPVRNKFEEGRTQRESQERSFLPDTRDRGKPLASRGPPDLRDRNAPTDSRRSGASNDPPNRRGPREPPHGHGTPVGNQETSRERRGPNDSRGERAPSESQGQRRRGGSRENRGPGESQDRRGGDRKDRRDSPDTRGSSSSRGRDNSRRQRRSPSDSRGRGDRNDNDRRRESRDKSPSLSESRERLDRGLSRRNRNVKSEMPNEKTQGDMNWNQLEATEILLAEEKVRDGDGVKRPPGQIPTESPPMKQPRPNRPRPNTTLLPLPPRQEISPQRMRPPLMFSPSRGPPRHPGPRPRPALLKTPRLGFMIDDGDMCLEEGFGVEDSQIERFEDMGEPQGIPRGPRPLRPRNPLRLSGPRRRPQLNENDEFDIIEGGNGMHGPPFRPLRPMGPRNMYGDIRPQRNEISDPSLSGEGGLIGNSGRFMRPRFPREPGMWRGGLMGDGPRRIRNMNPNERMQGPRHLRGGLLDHPRGLLRHPRGPGMRGPRPRFQV